jgi:hypothetical protein
MDLSILARQSGNHLDLVGISADEPKADIHWGRSKPQAQSAGVPPDERAHHDRVLLLATVNACKMIGE